MNSMLKLFFVDIWLFWEDNTLFSKKNLYMDIMKYGFLYIEKSFLGVIMAIFSLYFTDGLAKDISSKKKKWSE